MVRRKHLQTIFSDIETALAAYLRSQGAVYFTIVLSSFLMLGVMGVLYALLPVVLAQVARPKAPADVVVTADTRVC